MGIMSAHGLLSKAVSPAAQGPTLSFAQENSGRLPLAFLSVLSCYGNFAHLASWQLASLLTGDFQELPLGLLSREAFAS